MKEEVQKIIDIAVQEYKRAMDHAGQYRGNIPLACVASLRVVGA